ncbi:uncharacterized_abhydrolase domain-containing protein [Hexamita inflata]|uniref:Uncharacterized abhydrolase domain-containing protein n=1 Tax=Hexamita inflata TaxID=28002 RepID=A0AA86U2A0_9EUKA|nr:uncharacterized abhydrolase domain-containing protein [Hexamita inflata]CAI9928483.1 uncharacterized abhydrolase domain-containing protein [Hexamita inflata]
MKGLRAPSKMLQKINNQVNNQQEQNTQNTIEEEITIDQYMFDIQQQELQQYINSLQKIENKQYIIDRIDVICSRQKLQQEYADSLDYFHRYSQKIFRQLKYFYKCQIKDEFSTKIQTMKRNQLRSINKTLETYCTNQYKLVQDYYDSSYNNTVENMYRIIQQLRQLTSKAIETALEPKTPFHLMNVVTYEDLVKLNGIDLTIDNIDMYRLYEAYRYIVVEDYEKRSNKAIALLETVYQEQKDLGNPLCYQVQNLIEIEKQFQVYVFQAESRFQLQILFDVYNEMRIRLFVKVTNEKLLQQAVLVNLKLFQQLFSRDYEQVQHWIQNAGQIDNKRKDVVKELNLVYNELQKTRYAMKGTDSLEKLEALVKAHLLRDVPYKLYQITGNLDTNNNIELDYYPDQDFENIEIDFQLDNFEVKHTLDYNNHDTTNMQHQNSQESSQLFDEDEDNQENQETIDEVNIKLKELQMLPQNEMILKQQIEDSFDNNEEDFDDGGFDDDEEDYKKEKEQEAERLRLEEERIQKEQEEKQRLEEERIQKEHEEKQRLEEERIQKEHEEKQRLEEERIQKEQEEKQRLEEERIQKEHEQKQRLEEERIQKEQEEKQRLEEERIQKEHEEKQRLEEERIQKEQEEKQRLEEERIQKEQEEKQRLEEERIQKEQEEKQRLEEERIQKEQEEKQRLEEERIQKEHEEKQRLEEERIQKEQEEKQRLEEERIQKEHEEKQRLEEEQIQKEHEEKQRLEEERIKQLILEEQKEQERQEQQRLEQQQSSTQFTNEQSISEEQSILTLNTQQTLTFEDPSVQQRQVPVKDINNINFIVDKLPKTRTSEQWATILKLQQEVVLCFDESKEQIQEQLNDQIKIMKELMLEKCKQFESDAQYAKIIQAYTQYQHYIFDTMDLTIFTELSYEQLMKQMGINVKYKVEATELEQEKSTQKLICKACVTALDKIIETQPELQQKQLQNIKKIEKEINNALHICTSLKQLFYVARCARKIRALINLQLIGPKQQREFAELTVEIQFSESNQMKSAAFQLIQQFKSIIQAKPEQTAKISVHISKLENIIEGLQNEDNKFKMLLKGFNGEIQQLNEIQKEFKTFLDKRNKVLDVLHQYVQK